MAEIRDIFLSHATADNAFARRLAADLSAQLKNGLPISYWLDEAEIQIGASVPGAINSGLERSIFFAALMTPNYFNSSSGWTDAEWHAALHIDPDNRQKRFIPILAKDCPHIPPLLRHFRWVDLRGNAYGSEFDFLLKKLRGEEDNINYRGRHLDSRGTLSIDSLIAERASVVSAPDVISERLTCNLLPILALPDTVYSAPLNAEARKQFRTHIAKKNLITLIEKVAKEAGLTPRRIPPFRLSGDIIYSFYPLDKSSSLFRPIISVRKCERIPSFKLREDPNNQLVLISLLNMSIQKYAQSIGLLNSYEAGRGWRFFFPPAHGNIEKYVNWIPSRKAARRTVTKPLRPGDSRTEWLHAGAYFDITALGDDLFLKVRPTWLVTLDGRHPKSGPDVGRIVNRWTN